MIGIVLVSHSHALSQGLAHMAMQVSYNLVKVVAAGGVDDDIIGTNVERIYQAIQAVYSPDGVLVLLDLGSALLSTQMAIEMCSPQQQSHIRLSSAPLVEGAIMATIEASLGHSLEDVNAAAEAARKMEKIVI